MRFRICWCCEQCCCTRNLCCCCVAAHVLVYSYISRVSCLSAACGRRQVELLNQPLGLVLPRPRHAQLRKTCNTNQLTCRNSSWPNLAMTVPLSCSCCNRHWTQTGRGDTQCQLQHRRLQWATSQSLCHPVLLARCLPSIAVHRITVQ